MYLSYLKIRLNFRGRLSRVDWSPTLIILNWLRDRAFNPHERSRYLCSLIPASRVPLSIFQPSGSLSLPSLKAFPTGRGFLTRVTALSSSRSLWARFPVRALAAACYRSRTRWARFMPCLPCGALGYAALLRREARWPLRCLGGTTVHAAWHEAGNKGRR